MSIRSVTGHIFLNRNDFLWAGFVIGLLLSGCSSSEEASGTVRGAHTSPKGHYDLDTGSRVSSATSRSNGSASSDTSETAAISVPVPDPASLVGYDESSIEALFGPPSFTRRDPPAELWQYRNENCTLDLFLYEDSAGSFNVTHLEIRETDSSADATERCLRTIIGQKQAGASPS